MTAVPRPLLLLLALLCLVGLQQTPAAASTLPGAQGATIAVSYLGDWPAEARQAFDHAVGIWAARLNSPVAITVSASWGTMFYSMACECQPSWTTMDGTLYPTALANAISGSDRNGPAYEMAISCNSSRGNWYFGTDGHPASNQVDLVTVVLHEMGHGLGFATTMHVDYQGIGSWGLGTGYPSIYDRFLANSSGQKLVSTCASPSAELGAQLTSDSIFFAGANASAANGGAMPKLHAPTTWLTGASISHLDEARYNGTADSLMTPRLDRGEAHHDPGAVALGILQDLGWSVNAPPPPPPPGLEGSLFLPLVLSLA